jgi:plastocyanin
VVTHYGRWWGVRAWSWRVTVRSGNCNGRELAPGAPAGVTSRREASRRAALATVAAGALSLSAVACGGSTTKASTATASTAAPAAGSAAPVAAKVKIVNFTFDPMAVTVKVGGTVTWVQVDSVGHSVQSDDAAWVTSPVLMPGQTFAHTFTKVGTYAYICGLHTYMTGTVAVVK